jgi:hypothetical protein
VVAQTQFVCFLVELEAHRGQTSATKCCSPPMLPNKNAVQPSYRNPTQNSFSLCVTSQELYRADKCISTSSHSHTWPRNCKHDDVTCLCPSSPSTSDTNSQQAPFGFHPARFQPSQVGEKPHCSQDHYIAHPLRTFSTLQNQSLSSTSLAEYQLSLFPPLNCEGMNLNGYRVYSTALRQEHMEISSVISLNDGDGKRSARFADSGKLPNVEYSLRFRQQPLAARSCGFADRDRKVIDPPPIIQLTIKGTNLTPE